MFSLSPGAASCHKEVAAVHRKFLCLTISVAEQRVSVSGEANRLRCARHSVAQLLNRELFFGGHEGNALAIRSNHVAAKICKMQSHKGLRATILIDFIAIRLLWTNNRRRCS